MVLQVDNNDKMNMLNPAGRVVSAPVYMKKELLSKGWAIITNPKEEYYPTYDKRNGSWQKDLAIVEDIDPSNFLEVERI